MITRQHVDKMAKIILLTGSIVGYAYLMELFIAWYSGNLYENLRLLATAHSALVVGTAWPTTHDVLQRHLAADLLVQDDADEHYVVVFIVCQFVNAGMWFERFVIIVTSLAQDFLPSFVGPLLADLGRDLDLHRHLRHLPFALPALHALPADDRDVGSEGRRRRRPTRTTTPPGEHGHAGDRGPQTTAH